MGGYGTWNIGMRTRTAGRASRLLRRHHAPLAGRHEDDKTWALLENTKLTHVRGHGDKDGASYAPDRRRRHVKELGGDIKSTRSRRRARPQGGDPQGSVADELEAFVTRRAEPASAKVTYVSSTTGTTAPYWLRIASAPGPDRARLEGSIDKAHNSVHLVKSDSVELARITSTTSSSTRRSP